MNVRTTRRIQRLLAYLAPLVVLLAGAWHTALAQFAENELVANLALLFLTATLAVVLHRRSHGRESAWFGARVLKEIEQNPEDQVNPLSADVALILATVFLCTVAVVQL
ncbi:hypothetical protein [Piscinibacter sp.]|uniref:hypothetical protein n=1 Tax=Piscinibacter sp. TaxID=1903157 RepID=UPI0039E6332F